MPKKNVYEDLTQILDQLRTKTAEGPMVDQSEIVNKAGDPDDQTSGASEGSRSSENVTDVKTNVGDNSVDGSSAAAEAGATQMNPLNDIGTKVRPTGEDTASEEVAKDKKDDAGTAKKELEVGTASDPKFASMSLEALENDILTDITVAIKTAAAAPVKTAPVKTTAVAKPVKTAEAEEQEKVAVVLEDLLTNYADDVEAGYKAASASIEETVKTASESISQDDEAIMFNIVKEAQNDAEIAAMILDSYVDGLRKQGGLDPAMLEAAAPAAMEEGEQTIDPAMLEAAALEGAEGMEPGMEDATAVEGTDMGDDEAVIEQIAQALEAEGVTPEQLAEAIAAEQAGGEEAMAPEAELMAAKEASDKAHKAMLDQISKVLRK
jgi:hypothetical protein